MSVRRRALSTKWRTHCSSRLIPRQPPAGSLRRRGGSRPMQARRRAVPV
jgi:hypothetical protein